MNEVELRERVKSDLENSLRTLWGTVSTELKESTYAAKKLANEVADQSPILEEVAIRLESLQKQLEDVRSSSDLSKINRLVMDLEDNILAVTAPERDDELHGILAKLQALIHDIKDMTIETLPQLKKAFEKVEEI